MNPGDTGSRSEDLLIRVVAGIQIQIVVGRRAVVAVNTSHSLRTHLLYTGLKRKFEYETGPTLIDGAGPIVGWKHASTAAGEAKEDDRDE